MDGRKSFCVSEMKTKQPIKAEQEKYTGLRVVGTRRGGGEQGRQNLRKVQMGQEDGEPP